MSTVAKVYSRTSSHWYYMDGRPCYELPKKTGKGMKSPTLADARELNLLPGVTTILKVMHKPALQDWLIEQAVLAVMSTPRKPQEKDDEFVHRVLHVDKIQEQEAEAAAERGRSIHDAIELALHAQPFDERWKTYVMAVFPIVESLGKMVWTEKYLIGDGYAGRSDLLVENENSIVLLDIKTAKKMPEKGSWLEHKMQTAAYAETLGNVADRHILTGNIYVSTSDPGKVILFVQEDWKDTYLKGFRKLLEFWQWYNNYYPSRNGGGK